MKRRAPRNLAQELPTAKAAFRLGLREGFHELLDPVRAIARLVYRAFAALRLRRGSRGRR